MEDVYRLNLKYRFEKTTINQRPLSNAIERFGELASQIVSTAPSLIPYLNFGTAENISNGNLDPGMIAPQFKYKLPVEDIRIRCIEDASGPVLEYFYNKEGFIKEVVIFNSFREKYSWSDDGNLLSISGENLDTTQFRYNNNGLLSLVSYPNGSIFKYDYDNLNRLSRITFPDGVPIKYERNEHGLLTRTECLDGIFEYFWDDKHQLQKISFQDKTNSFSLEMNETQTKLNLKCSLNSSMSIDSLSSVLGMWKYDKGKMLHEIISTGGVRFKKKGNEEEGIELWTHSGQTFYHFDKSNSLMKMINSDGTTALFRRYISQRVVMIASVKGISILQYDKNGYLCAEREQQSNGLVYKFNNKKKLSQINSDDKTTKINWTVESKIKDISIDDLLTCSISYLSGIPDTINISISGLSYLDCLGTVTSFIWDWEAMSIVRRLIDNSFRGK